jgi:hypothetical protein
MGSLACYVCCRKEMLGWICEKMVTQELAPRGDKFFASNPTVVGNMASTCSGSCVAG